ncbi:uncharacterized protein LOC123708459 [Pieris brassicae]|uniref:uncharacterized protein LOC123708459 n=1 Tax=Pieris brassicae TaxID=7116 RepID=UPI001E661442|nr:uncharacterized protein LOC123708459 [Pieris brassicae]
MGILSFIPKVNRFSYCTRDLKCACVIIIFIGMLSSMHTASLLCLPHCRSLFEASSFVKIPTNILRWLLFVCELIIIANCFAFLLGIFMNYRQIYADLLIISAIVTSLISVPYAVLMVIQEQYTDCRWYYSQIFHLILYFFMWGYFIVIVNSYEG